MVEIGLLPDINDADTTPAGETPDKAPTRGVTRGLVENFLSLSVLQAANYLLPLITLPYLVRILGIDKFGLVAFAQAATAYFIILTDYGFNLSATREIASHRDDLEKVSRIFSTVMVVRSGLMFVCFGLLFLLLSTVERFGAESDLFLLSYGLVLGNVLFPVWFFQGMEKMKYSTGLNIAARSIFVVLVFTLVHEVEDYLLVPVLTSIGSITAGLISLYLIRTHFNMTFSVPALGDIKYQITSSSQFFLSRLSTSMYTSMNTVVLGLTTSDQMVGYYVAAEKLFIAMRTAFQPLVLTLFPYMTAQPNIRLFKKVFVVAIALACLGGGAVFILRHDVIRLVFGVGLEPSADILGLFSLALPAIVASILLGYPFLAARGHASYANFSVAAGPMGHLILIAMLIPMITPFRVALVAVFTEIVILTIRLQGVHKHRLWRSA